ncbi:MAG TPA: ROK family protein [Candidatus Acidoferrales bacterium]|nr:ROK family protein [Candidatus Acidoferrales bacterium]
MQILGIDLGGTNVRAGLVEDDSLVRVESQPLNKSDNAGEVVDEIADLIRRFFPSKIVGIGIGVPSVVDIERGIVYDVANIPSWKEVPLKSLLEEKFDVPVYVNNDANCFAVGEKYFGKGKGYQNVVGLIVGTGLGAGIVIKDKLYAGTNCGAGEFGCVPYKDKNYEYYCSGQFFTNEYHTPGEDFFKRAADGDREAIDVFSIFGANLGDALKLVMYSVDPEIIVLGGSVCKSFDFFKDAMYDAIRNFAYPKSLKNIRIEVSEIENVAILGAAALYYDEMRK